MTDQPYTPPMAGDDPQTLEAATLAELEQLWGDMVQARRDALNGVWSVQCDNLVDRIVMLSRFVGPLRWGQVGVSLLRDGTYERVHREAGIDYPPVDWARVAEVEAASRHG
jgi:hypothetical protein